MKRLLVILFALALIFSFAKSANAANILVDDDERQCQIIKGINPVFKDIQAAVNAAAEGDTIIICDGTYKGGIIIIKNNITLTTRSNTPGTVYISPKAGESFGISVAANNVSIKNLVIYDFPNEGIITSIVPPDKTFAVKANGTLIENNAIYNNRIGISLNNSSGSRVIRNKIQNSLASGIVVSEASNESITSNIISDNGTLFTRRENFDNGGIRLFMSNNNTINGNTLENNISGIFVETSSENNIEGNNIKDSKTEGVTLCFGSSNNLLTLNQSNNNRRGLLVCRGGELNNNNTVRRNTLLNNTIFDIVDNPFFGISTNSYIENTCKTSNPQSICSK